MQTKYRLKPSSNWTGTWWTVEQWITTFSRWFPASTHRTKEEAEQKLKELQDGGLE